MTHQPIPMLRWVFRRNTQMLTCEVDAASRRWDVCLVPHWDVGGSVVERFETPLSALERHAEIARQLRAAGWAVVAYAPPAAA
jgi:hypothetical protein